MLGLDSSRIQGYFDQIESTNFLEKFAEIKKYIEDYKESKKLKHSNKGKESKLSPQQTKELSQHDTSFVIPNTNLQPM